jgi:Fe-S oxidoreductase
MNFDLFVIPFCIGALILFAVLITRYSMWMIKLPRIDRRKAWLGFIRFKFLNSIWEVFRESLIHRKIFRINAMLGWMHMSFAFGWFLLILIGAAESKFHTSKAFNMPYDPIFLRFFEHDTRGFQFGEGFTFIMDLLLLVLLSATILAWTKRIYSRLFGMRKTTKLILGDKIALYSLWAIFPLRFLAESFTSGLYNNGGFLTGTFGNMFAATLPLEYLEYPAWWAYSSALCSFFIFLPFSRYMHIPTENFLIYLRNCGIRTDKKHTGYTEFEIYSCSRCGICIDKCQLSEVRNNKIQGVYFIHDLRRNILSSETAYNCMLCGRCTSYCPVGIDINRVRLLKRQDFAPESGFNYAYIEEKINVPPFDYDVVYFAGCMTHLTPTIKNAMVNILKKSGDRYIFLDKEGSICCGRPLLLAGNEKQARDLKYENKKLIAKTGAKKLVTSCPICYNIFKNEYNLNIEVLHHSQYIQQLIENNKIKLKHSDKRIVYHDPCELGRANNVYDDPRTVISHCANIESISVEKEKAVCCGSSLADFYTQGKYKMEMRDKALKILMSTQPDELITACPLCKKTFTYGTEKPVKDISELVEESIADR